ncbi:MAG: SusD/RagB family nutrient-binding outer membrane lipoprotein, partial [Chitinophagaceae bacterium]|nr:SusD/RagB family nutrient-binding outer membrane lipoprotein [Chitinophagaceae bacterium]
IFADLDAAIALLNNATATEPSKNPDIATSDFVYAGNTTRWKQFANTLRLRMLVHLHNGLTTTTVAPGVNIATQVSKITADGFLMEGQSAHIQPGFSGTKPAPYYRLYVTNEAGTGSQRDFLRASKYAIDYYKFDGDPRIDRFYVSPTGTTAGHAGIVFGTPSGGSVPTGAQLSTVRGPGLVPNGAASRAWILTSVESLFLQAEARQRGVITSGPTADVLLTRAIRESFVWLGLTTAQADTYIAFNAGFPDVDYFAPSIVAGQPGGGIYTILSQKWFALNTIAPFEVWSDYRRTDIRYGVAAGYDPGPPLSVDPNRTATSIPRRLFYPQNEYNYNAANVAAEGSINVFSGKVFWDLN